MDDDNELFDDALLSSLGVSAFDREVFEQDFLDRLEQQLGENELPEPDATEGNCDTEKQDQDDKKGVGSSDTTTSEADRAKIGISNQFDSSEALQDTNYNENERREPSSGSLNKETNSSMLKSLLLGTTSNNKHKHVQETENERKVRTGEMTPFGNVVEKSTPKKDSFLGFFQYMKHQITLNTEFQKKRSVEHRKKENTIKPECETAEESKVSSAVDSDSESDDNVAEKQSRKKSKRRKDSLDMNVLFPKKRPKKAVVGTRTSDDPRNAQRKPGRSLAETTGVYMNESDDSDYVPPYDSDCSEGGVPRRAPARKNEKKRKRPTNYKEPGSDSDYGETERPAKRRKKITDDGDIASYRERVVNWKKNEFRFTGEMQTLDGNFKIPTYLWESLYNYQKVGVKWLWELHQQNHGGILGDEMGLGKTVEVIAFLAGVSCSDLMFRFSKYRGLGPSLIVCPATVMHQWVREFHTWWPPFRVAILHESGSFGGYKSSLIRSLHEGKGILVTTYQGLVNNKDEILKHEWHYVIVDEGHKIRNPDAKLTIALKQIPTPHRLILSGSPLQNNLKELWSLFDFVYPGKLGTLPVFMEHFAVPITQGGYSNASDVQVAGAFKCATTLRTIISPYLLRRLKSDVSKHLDLPPKNEQVLFCKLTDDQRDAYTSYLNSDQVKAIVKGRYEVFVGLIYLRKICNHPHLYDGGLSDNPKIQKLSRIPKMSAGVKGRDSHYFSQADYDGSDIEVDSSGTFGHWSKSGKMIVIKTLLKLWKQQQHKVLLFTQSRQMLCILENFVRCEKYTYLRMDGSTSIGSRQPMIEKFNEDPSMFVFMLTTRVGGLGVNLTGANRVIIFDPDWNPSIDLQARERAWRIGQSRQVTIYRLITSGTIEEKIYHRQIFKQFLTNRVLKNPKQKRLFKSSELTDLFTLNETRVGTESEDLFAGTGSKVKVPKRQRPTEKKSGKFRRVPHLIKQALAKPDNPDGDGEGAGELADSKCSKPSASASSSQDDYVLRKLFKKSGVESAFRHDKIVDSNESDYLLVEKEAEKLAKDAVRALKQSRQQCWSPDTGNVSWTGQNGTVRPPPPPEPEAPCVPVLKRDFSGRTGKKKPTKLPQALAEEPLETALFSNPKLESKNSEVPLSSSELLNIIRQRKRRLIEPKCSTSNGATTLEGQSFPVPEKHLELLDDIRSFIAFRATVDGQASTDELLAEFANKLPPKETPLFKQLLKQLCSHRLVEGRTIWRLKPEFR